MLLSISDLRSIREKSQRELDNLLKDVKDIHGNRCLIIDPKLSGSLSLIIQTSKLKELGLKLRHLSEEPVQTESTKVIYLVRSQLSFMKFIASHIQNDISKAIQETTTFTLSLVGQLRVRRFLSRKKCTTWLP